MVSFAFTFAPIPLTAEQSPLLHAAILIRRHQAQIPVVTKLRYRIKPTVDQARSIVAEEKIPSNESGS